jgi:hypothetical protein
LTERYYPTYIRINLNVSHIKGHTLDRKHTCNAESKMPNRANTYIAMGREQKRKDIPEIP